ncbi:hypothetical protein L1286_16855 [Pseudoalteromonas sp. SMS1]|uniref:hypothetical protein n=1 Tax=Pseudoalteromonas sp. SMS1 TaxID=2908894 RepID=UPI001F4215D6|nr:hypothetical protein [Pseudoalteromonas sp. SMS1]MCF2859155.1 hypothetical protein [Pseudoalteromonas sp. SMS1]
MYKTLSSIALMGASFTALGQGVVEFPAHAYFEEIKKKSIHGVYETIKIPKSKKRKIKLPAGEYKYRISLQSSSSDFEGEINIKDGEKFYIHNAITPDRKRVFSWPSKSEPRSDAFNIESKAHFCRGVFQYPSPVQDYSIDACIELKEKENGVGYLGMGYIYDKGIGKHGASRGKAIENYTAAFQKGELEAAAANFLIDRNSDQALKMLDEAASKGNQWATEIAALHFANSDKQEELDKSRTYSMTLLDKGIASGYKSLTWMLVNDAIKNDSPAIEAAAHFNLFSLHSPRLGYYEKNLKKHIETLLLSSDLDKVNDKTVELANHYLSNANKIYIDTSKLSKYKDRKELSISINDDFSMPIKDFSSVYVLPVSKLDGYFRVTLNDSEGFLSEDTFKVADSSGEVFCTFINERADSIEMIKDTENNNCGVEIEKTVSAWTLLNQYM